ncbi:MAG: transposase [Gammaproteobacteria bacterium]
MPRIARLVVPGYPHHVTQRGSRRQKTFFYDADYRLYTRLIARYAIAAHTEIWAYCLMPNHVHLVLMPTKEFGLKIPLAEVHRRYAITINTREGWRGHLWQERFHSFVMDEPYLHATVRYVERNPVAAGLCDRAEQWPWSSARAHIEGVDDGTVTVQPMLARVGDWRGYLDSESPAEELATIRKHQRTGRPLGDASFIEELEAVTGLMLKRKKPGPRPNAGGGGERHNRSSGVK